MRPAPVLSSSLMSLALALGATAQPASPPPAGATTAPAAPRFTVTVPPGYEKVTVGGHVALCLPQDAAWVRKALTDLKPATRPATMPADLLKRVVENRATVVKQMTSDLALADDKSVNEFFDNKLLSTLRKLDALKPGVYFLVCNRQQLRELAQTGWGEPRIHYNRVANEVSVDDNIRLALDRPMDDAVLPAFYDEKDAPDARSVKLATGVQQLEASLVKMIAEQGQPQVFNLVSQYMGETHFDPIKLRRDQQWFALGTVGYLAAKYAGQLTPTPKETWLKDITFDHPRMPVTARAIDLTKPLEESAMKPAAVPYYHQAMRRKAIGVVAKWAEKSGDAALTKVFTAVRSTKPADGAALVTLIQQVTGADLAKDLAAQ
jgi:hypothetical protein